MSALLLAINRISSLFMPLSYEKVWREYFAWVLLFYFAVPFFFCFHLLASPVFVSTESVDHFFTYKAVLTGAFFGYAGTVKPEASTHAAKPFFQKFEFEIGGRLAVSGVSKRRKRPLQSADCRPSLTSPSLSPPVEETAAASERKRSFLSEALL
ncbi:unnamed protein product [Bursaphelenchus okinawaensis]|uniref:Serpentine receptor class gamma n=1 Tax=Bursaphelenchus okinawaensis TaxID=465554 RepID=A0A811L967_9BILA|nr:unnamed protein product [Bursaphelenchus okinawaensis]CAG9118914.1 unnamed protein product [Bursaphelenchus okinawaensis]